MKPRPSHVTVNGRTYERIPVKTPFIQIKQPLEPIIQDLVLPQTQPGDWIAISEKVVTISQGRVIHISTVHPSRLARLIVRHVTPLKNDIGYSHPAKMQVAIMQAGYWRVAAAMVIGGLSRLILRRRGDFYRIAGHHISEIDGFNPTAMPPFDEFAMVGPGEPDAYCQDIETKFHLPTAIIDGNNINVEVLGASSGLPVSRAQVREILLDNPMGQGDELTPIMIVRGI